MGTDKGLIHDSSENKIWSQIAKEKLSSLCSKTYLSINQNQFSSYSEYFNKDELIIDSNALKDIAGPIKGLLTFYLTFPKEDIFFLACDIVNISSQTLKTLYENYCKQKEEYKIFCVQTESHLEPLCAIYASESLSVIRKNLSNDFSLQKQIKKQKYFSLNNSYFNENELKNFNYPQEP